MSNNKTIKRKNCFGDTEELDRDSVAEALNTEELYNHEIEAYLVGVARSEGRERSSVVDLERLSLPPIPPTEEIDETVDRKAETVRPPNRNKK